MGRYEPVPELDAIIARKFGVPRIQTVLRMLTDEAKSRAPEVRVWVTMRDERVRKSHFETDTQTIPANLRFKLPNRAGGHDLARHPRDPDLPRDQREGCRCDDPTLPDVLRESIHATGVDVNGNHVSGSVETRFPRAAESEHGTDKDEAAHFMLGALEEVAARLRAGHSG